MPYLQLWSALGCSVSARPSPTVPSQTTLYILADDWRSWMNRLQRLNYPFACVRLLAKDPFYVRYNFSFYSVGIVSALRYDLFRYATEYTSCVLHQSPQCVFHDRTCLISLCSRLYLLYRFSLPFRGQPRSYFLCCIHFFFPCFSCLCV